MEFLSDLFFVISLVAIAGWLAIGIVSIAHYLSTRADEDDIAELKMRMLDKADYETAKENRQRLMQMEKEVGRINDLEEKIKKLYKRELWTREIAFRALEQKGEDNESKDKQAEGSQQESK